MENNKNIISIPNNAIYINNNIYIYHLKLMEILKFQVIQLCIIIKYIINLIIIAH